MTNESKFETLAISSLPLGNGYRCTINLEHHVDVPLPHVNAHVRDFLSASAAFATKMRDAIDPPPTGSAVDTTKALADEERDYLERVVKECLRQCSVATRCGNVELAERWQERAKEAAAKIERLGGER